MNRAAVPTRCQGDGSARGCAQPIMFVAQDEERSAPHVFTCAEHLVPALERGHIYSVGRL